MKRGLLALWLLSVSLPVCGQGPPEPITLRSENGDPLDPNFDLTPDQADDDIENLWHLFYGTDKTGSASPTFSFYLPMEATLTAADCNASGEKGQVRIDLSAAGTINWLAYCTGTGGWQVLVDDDVPEAGDFTALALTGDVTSSGLATTIAADSVALGTDTTGGYAASSTEGGAATTATALAANGSNCSAGSYTLGVDASGAAESCTDATTEIDSAIATHTSNASAHHAVFVPAANPATDHSGFLASLQENGANELFGETMGTACTSGQILKSDGAGGLDCAADADSGGAPAFSAITAATNTTAAMVVGTGASLAVSGSGTIAATSATTATTATTANAGDSATAFFSSGTIETARLPAQVKSMYWPAGAMSADGTQCADPAEVTINSGPKLYTVICTDNDASTLYGQVTMPDGWDAGTVTYELVYIQTAADTSALNSDIAAQCHGNGETVNSTWGTEVAIDDAAVVGSNANDHTTSGAVTPAGTCAAGDTLYWRWQLDATGTTTAVATLHIVGLKMEYTWTATD